MTITNENLRNDYTANGSTVAYDFTFKVLAKENLQVIVTNASGAETVLTLTTDYTVSLNADTGLGTVTLVTAPTSGFKITILRNMDFEQNTSIQNQGTSQFSGRSLEQAFDKLTLLALQLKESAKRAILLPKSSRLSGLQIPVSSANAGKAIIVNAAGDNLDVKSLASIGAAAFSALGLSVVAAETAAAMRTLLGAVIGTDVQAQNANLSALAGLSGAANKTPYFTGSGAMGLAELPSNRNAILNGDFNIWQRGTSFSSAANGTYFADRFVYAKSGAMVHDLSRSTDVPTVANTGRVINYSALIDCTTIDNSIAAGDFCGIEQRIEGFNWKNLAQKTITLSFWVKATKIGIHCVYLKNSGGDRGYVAEYTINAADTWEFKTVTITASPSAGTWDYANGIGVTVGFTLVAGSTYQTTAGAWQNGGYLATANQVNACDNAANNFRISSVQLEIGSIATPFDERQIQQELASCQRYYELATTWGVSYAASGGAIQRALLPFKVVKRASPTVAVSVVSGSLTSPSTSAVDTINAWVGFSSASSGLEGRFSCTIDSEL